MAEGECTVCLNLGSRYKCPRCFARYCSVNCFKRHKEETCNDPAEKSAHLPESSPSDATCQSSTRYEEHHAPFSFAPKEVDNTSRIERLLKDIPEEGRLRRSALDALGSSEVAEKLSDPATRNFIATVMESRDRREAHDRLRGFMSQSPAFSEFSSSCLNVVNKRPPDVL